MTKILKTFVLLGTVLGVGLAAGAALVHYDTAAYQSARALAKKALGRGDNTAPARASQADGAGQSGHEYAIETTLLRLVGDSADIPSLRHGSGGGMTALGDGVLLLTFDGQIHYATNAQDVTRVNIEAPDNGFDEYAEDAAGRFSDYEHWLFNYRYNDILYIERNGIRSLYASFTRYHQDRVCYVNAIAKVDLQASDIREETITEADWETVHETSPCLGLKRIAQAIEGQTAGGRIAYDGQSTLFLGSGDYHFDGIYGPGQISQDDDAEYGKVVAIDLDTGEARIVSKGNRNMQGVAWHDGALYTLEHTFRGGDELNRIVEGANYGWPLVSLGTLYDKRPFPGSPAGLGRHDGFELPVFSWVPSVAISSLNPITSFHEYWNGDMLMGTLRGNSLLRLRIADGRLLLAEEIPVGERIRYAQPVDGGIFLWTDTEKLIYLTPEELTSNDPLASALGDLSDEHAENLDAIRQALLQCSQCHSLSAGVNENAPSLAAIFEHDIASTTYSGYSEALRAAEGVWDAAALETFLLDPDGFAAGTTMPPTGLEKGPVLDGVIAALRSLSR